MTLEKRIILFGHLDREGPDLDQLMSSRGFRVYSVIDEVELLDIVSFSQPDAVILLGNVNRPFVSRLVTLSGSTTQTLVVSLAPGIQMDEAVSLLDIGVDHVAVTYQPDLLAAHIRALLRRAGRERSAPSMINLGYLQIDLQQRRVTVDEREVSLTRTEFDVLRVLAERPGTVLPSGEIMQQVMGVRLPEAEAQDLLKVHVHRIRQKLEQDQNNPRVIRTVRGHGYMYAFERRAKDRATVAAGAG